MSSTKEATGGGTRKGKQTTPAKTSVVRSDARFGAESPGGTKTIHLDVGFDASAWKEQLRKEAAEAMAQDRLADAAYREAGMEVAAPEGKLGSSSPGSDSSPAAEKPRADAPPEKSRGGHVNTDDDRAPGGAEAAGEQKFEGEFKWDNFDQVRELSEQNAKLLGDLSSKDREIERLKELVVANEAVSGISADRLRAAQGRGDVGDVDHRDRKIVELAKKNRKVNLTLERERTKVRQLQSDIEQLQSLNAAKSARLAQIEGKQGGTGPGSGGGKVADRAKPAGSSGDEKQLRRRAEQLRRKLDRTNADLRKVFRMLQSEVGDSVNLQEVIKNGTEEGWKGRAQQIVNLKTRLRRAQQEAEALRASGGTDQSQSQSQSQPRSHRDAMLRQHPNFKSSVSRGQSVESKARNELQQMNKRRAEATEAALQELDEMHEIAAMQKQKLDGHKARIRTLESDNKKMRTDMKVLLKKTAADDGLIDALRQEVAQNRTAMSAMSRKLQMLRSGEGGSEGEFSALKAMAANQSKQIDRQEQLVTTLRSELEQLQSNASKDLVSKAQKDLALHDKNTDMSLLRVENDRLTELGEMFKGKYQDSKRRADTAETSVRELERRCVELERRLGNISHGGLKRQPPADQFQALKDQLALQVEENEALKASFRAAMASKDDELRILRSLSEQHQRVYEKAIKDVRAQVKMTAGQAQARIIQSQAQNDGKMMQQLQADNDALRKQLVGLQKKFRDLEHQRRRRGQLGSYGSKTMGGSGGGGGGGGGGGSSNSRSFAGSKTQAPLM